MHKIRARIALLSLVLGAPALAAGQTGLPTSQPNVLYIIREEVKVGRTDDHARIEAGWPAAYEKAKSPDYYLALATLTGAQEVWYIAPFASHAAFADSMKRDDEPALAAELARLRKADSEFITSSRSLHARARADLSYGEYPDLTKMRFWEISTTRVRPGHEGRFAEAAKVYGAVAKRAGSKVPFRVYEVMAGMPGPTYLIFSSVAAFGEFDATLTNDEAVMKAATQEEGATLSKFMAESVITVESQRFRLDPGQSYVSKEVRDTDPAFWLPKKVVVKTVAPKPAPAPAKPPTLER
jgi:hypothetical protein